MFQIVDDLPHTGPWSPLPREADECQFRQTVCEAHLELADVPGPTGDQFRAVAARMAAELPTAGT
jgi:hypothetical protein